MRRISYKFTDEIMEQMPIAYCLRLLRNNGFDLEQDFSLYRSDSDRCTVFTQSLQERPSYRASHVGVDFAVNPDRCVIERKTYKQLEQEKKQRLYDITNTLKQNIKKQLDEEKTTEPEQTLATAQQQLTGRKSDEK